MLRYLIEHDIPIGSIYIELICTHHALILLCRKKALFGAFKVSGTFLCWGCKDVIKFPTFYELTGSWGITYQKGIKKRIIFVKRVPQIGHQENVVLY